MWLFTKDWKIIAEQLVQYEIIRIVDSVAHFIVLEDFGCNFYLRQCIIMLGDFRANNPGFMTFKK